MVHYVSAEIKIRFIPSSKIDHTHGSNGVTKFLTQRRGFSQNLIL